jgi:hypothetical protein
MGTYFKTLQLVTVVKRGNHYRDQQNIVKGVQDTIFTHSTLESRRNTSSNEVSKVFGAQPTYLTRNNPTFRSLWPSWNGFLPPFLMPPNWSRNCGNIILSKTSINVGCHNHCPLVNRDKMCIVMSKYST